ncbi:protein of unknown function [Methylocaldum szegediense]|uniref:Transposase n=1 Tax=Methylocaldum szegediense TaxID=73780 RepID=A0ABM9I3G2_9GAMM|nr:protein of unknown function [Methylocaldum szegediense]
MDKTPKHSVAVRLRTRDAGLIRLVCRSNGLNITLTSNSRFALNPSESEAILQLKTARFHAWRLFHTAGQIISRRNRAKCAESMGMWATTRRSLRRHLQKVSQMTHSSV